MTIDTNHIPGLSDLDLLTTVKTLARDERIVTVQLIASLAELDARQLYLGEGYSSLFTYCTQGLHLSEHAAYGRIEAARISRRFPLILDMLSDGAVTLTTIGLLAPLLTNDNHRELLTAARHKSKRDVECIVATWRPQTGTPSSVRKLPQPVCRPPRSDGPSAVADNAHDGIRRPIALSHPVTPTMPPLGSASVTPLAPERYRIQMTVTRDTHQKLREAQDLMRHQLPSGDPALIFDRALTVLLDELRKTKYGATVRPRAAKAMKASSRHIPANVRRAVWARDEGRCAFVGSNGRCTERGFLEYHHLVPFADGGATTTENLQLRCRAHNAFENLKWNGPAEPSAFRERRAGFLAKSDSAAVAI